MKALCRSVLAAGAATPRCECSDPFTGPLCSSTPACNGTLYLERDGTSQCCPSRRFISAAGVCCPEGSQLDVSGGCCDATSLDACGTCDGQGKGVDRHGQCCSGYLTEDLFCCPHPLDRCGACGDGTSCNPEMLLLLRDVNSISEASVLDITKDLLCAQFGYASTGLCPVSVSAGSGVLPASRRLRLQEKQHGFATMHGNGSHQHSFHGANSHVHDSQDSLAPQVSDIGFRVLQAWAEARGAFAIPAIALAPPTLWARGEVSPRRKILESGAGEPDVLELSVRTTHEVAPCPSSQSSLLCQYIVDTL